ncbi:prolyl oligopeptidase family serine peptidase [Ornithinibacillus sp. 4-3]|uniref:Prolyl oligopeptidase family serine peptidase n=1 Tax=Ornithinibacillus sp. 4-3 TaxID=3231488 RepID=A0AB39HPW3_9BACI
MYNDKRPITASDFTRLNVYSDPQFAPNGDSYVYVSTTVNDNKKYESHLFLQNLNEGSSKQWTFQHGRDSHPRFSPDGSQIVFQSNRSGVLQICLLSTAGGEAQQITAFQNGASKPCWSKDGKYIIFSASLAMNDSVEDQCELSKEEREKLAEEKANSPLIINDLKYKSDAKGFHDEKREQIILYNVEQATFTKLTSTNTNHQFHDISPDSNLILFTANLDEDADYQQQHSLYILNRSTNELKKAVSLDGMFRNAKFSPSGKFIASYYHDYSYASATLSELIVINVQTGEVDTVSKNWDVQLGNSVIGDTRLGESYDGPSWSDDEETLYFLGTHHGSANLYRTNLKEKKMETLYSNNNQVFGFSYHPPSNQFILGISEPTNPCNFYHFVEGKELAKLTDENSEWLDEIHLSEPETIWFTAKDGWKIQGWLLKPFDYKKGEKYPLVLEIHGGPHAMYGQSYFHEMQLLAAKGYVVLYTNPRGSHGYGQKFVDAVRTDYGGSDYTDLMSAVDHVLAHYDFIDESRLGVTGGSYGGFMTNWIVGHTDRFKAAVTQRSISNWLSFYGVSDIGHYFTEWELGVPRLDDPLKLWDFSPIKYAKNINTPLLILHGELDYRCPIEQGEQFFIALKHLKKEVEFIRFPNANHELSRSGDPSLRIERLRHICRWFELYL